MKGASAIIGAAALLDLSACSPADPPSSSARTSATASAAGAPSARAISTGVPGPNSATTAASVTIAVVGDTMLGNTPNLPPDPAAYFDAVESSLDHPPGYARYLKHAGFTVINDANNHSFDFGPTGQAQTGLPGEITIVKAHGIKVAFAAFAPYDYDASLLDLPAARVLIKRAGLASEDFGSSAARILPSGVITPP